MLRNTQQRVAKPGIFCTFPRHGAVGKPLSFTCHKFAQSGGFVRIGGAAVDPGIADLLGDNGQVVPLFPKHFRYFVHRTRFDRIGGELLFDRFQLFEDMLGARRTVIVERMVKIQNLFDARVLKCAAVVA